MWVSSGYLETVPRTRDTNGLIDTTGEYYKTEGQSLLEVMITQYFPEENRLKGDRQLTWTRVTTQLPFSENESQHCKSKPRGCYVPRMTTWYGEFFKVLCYQPDGAVNKGTWYQPGSSWTYSCNQRTDSNILLSGLHMFRSMPMTTHIHSK